MENIKIWPQPPLEHGDWIRLSARIERPGGSSHELWFDVAKEWKASISPSADAFAIATLFLGGSEKADIHVHGTVSPSLLRNLEELSLLWSTWKPGRYAPIRVAADVEAERMSSHPDEAVACFSGGVDGCFTMYRHRKGLCGRQRRNVAAGLLVQGFDIGINETGQFERASLSAENCLRSLDIPLVKMRTNLREFGVNWEDEFGAAMAASLSILNGRFGSGMLGSSERYDFFGSWGSTPLVDPFFSTETFRLIHDGAGFSRTQKVRLVNEWQTGVENLRVCWEGADPSRNCGRCEKCIRTILNFRAVGAGLPVCFSNDVGDSAIESIRVRSAAHLNELAGIMEVAETRGILGEPWVKVLSRKIAHARRGPSLTQRWKARLALRTRLRALYQSFKGKDLCAS